MSAMLKQLLLIRRPGFGFAAAASSAAGLAGGLCTAFCDQAPPPENCKRSTDDRVHTQTLLPALGPKAADTMLAGTGLFAGCSMLGVFELVLGVRLFAPPMMASGIIFFCNTSPPHPQGFLSGTLCSATLSFGVLTLASPIMPPVAAQGAAAGTLLVWYKATNALFPPAAVLAGLLATAASGAQTHLRLGAASAVRFLAFPWLAGHAWLYLCAHATSEIRLRTRVALTKQQLAARMHAQDDASLRRTFLQFDTSGDGALDADELKVALRVAVGEELSREDCEQLIAVADKDGTGTVDFGEFRAICREQL